MEVCIHVENPYACEDNFLPPRVELDVAKNHFIADVPAILHVCSETRKEALRTYTSEIRTKDSLNGMYLNFKLDTLYFPERVYLNHNRHLNRELYIFAKIMPHIEKIERVIVRKDARPIFSNCKESKK